MLISISTQSPAVFWSTYDVISTSDTEISFDPIQILLGIKITVYQIVELGLWTSVFPCFVLGYILFVTHGGNRYGPRYYFGAFPLMFVTIGSAGRQLVAWGRHLWNRPVGLHVVLTCLIYPLSA